VKNTTISTLALVGILACSGASADWRYGDSADKMTGKKTTTATIESSNSLDLSFPYQGKNFGNLMVRRHPSYGLDVAFSVDKGQIICRSYSGCSVTVRFDDKAPVKFNASEAADNDSKIIFLKDVSRFIASAKTAKSILIQPTLHQGGSPILEFRSAKPLEWNEAKNSPPTKNKAPAAQPAPKAAPATVWPDVPASLSGNR
jgi:hypothetical protein